MSASFPIRQHGNDLLLTSWCPVRTGRRSHLHSWMCKLNIGEACAALSIVFLSAHHCYLHLQHSLVHSPLLQAILRIAEPGAEAGSVNAFGDKQLEVRRNCADLVSVHTNHASCRVWYDLIIQRATIVGKCLLCPSERGMTCPSVCLMVHCRWICKQTS